MWAPLIQSYGYLAVFFGALIEGETILVLAGYSVSRGYLSMGPVLLIAIVSCAAADFFYFSLGRRYGLATTRRFPRLRRVRARAVLLLRDWGRAAAFLTRFAYGLRIVLPITMGAARMKRRVFIPFNLLGAATFSVVYVGLGYTFGETLQALLVKVRPYEKWIILGILLSGAVALVIREWRLRKLRDLPEVPLPPLDGPLRPPGRRVPQL
jgi:membrane protein DedA with SNARE-associated domain